MPAVTRDKSWVLTWEEDRLRIAEAGPDVPPGQLRDARGGWVPLSQIVGVHGWIDSWLSGVRVRLADGSSRDMLEADSGNYDFTATWNEYLFDGLWAYGAGRQLAAWLEVPYADA